MLKVHDERHTPGEGDDSVCKEGLELQDRSLVRVHLSLNLWVRLKISNIAQSQKPAMVCRDACVHVPGYSERAKIPWSSKYTRSADVSRDVGCEFHYGNIL